MWAAACEKCVIDTSAKKEGCSPSALDLIEDQTLKMPRNFSLLQKNSMLPPELVKGIELGNKRATY